MFNIVLDMPVENVILIVEKSSNDMCCNKHFFKKKSYADHIYSR